jgi:phenylpyruvate C(3)-methyltransferase
VPHSFTDAYVGAVLTHALATAFDLGLLAAIAEDGEGTPESLARGAGVDDHVVETIVRTLAWFGVLRWNGERVEPGPRFAEAEAEQAFAAWFCLGYGPLLARSRIVAGSAQLPPRQPGAVARSGADYGRRFVDAPLRAAIGEGPVSRIADLGCGSGARLLDWLAGDPSRQGIGIDVASEALAVAREQARAQGLAERVEFIQDDVQNLRASPRFSTVDLVISCFMWHDLFPVEGAVAALDGLQIIFPGASRVLLVDTIWQPLPAAPDVLPFIHGFQLIHGLLGEPVPDRAAWAQVLAATRWQEEREEELLLPHSYLWRLRRL